MNHGVERAISQPRKGTKIVLDQSDDNPFKQHGTRLLVSEDPTTAVSFYRSWAPQDVFEPKFNSTMPAERHKTSGQSNRPSAVTTC
jgi:hypothetical protein